MKQIKQICATLALGLVANAAQADCYVDYKAKRSADGLELHYGVLQLSDAECSDAGTMKRAVSGRIGVDGWTVLRVISRLEETEALNRQADAGQYYLKY